MAPFFASIIALCFVMVVFHYWRRLLGVEELVGEEWRDFLRWLGMGLATPVLLWIVFNVGWFGGPVWPYVRPVSMGLGKWWDSFRLMAGGGLFFVSSYWAGVSLLQLLWRAKDLTEAPEKFRRRGRTAAFILVPIAIAMIVFGGWAAVGLAMILCGAGMAQVTFGLKEEKGPAPNYGLAQIAINFGRYEEAEMQVLKELEQSEDDFDGWLLLAELYALYLDDLPAADEMVRDLCQQPNTTLSQASVALNRLADWHLKLARDPAAARRVLERICLRMPGTHMDRMARQRINQLPASHEEMLAQDQGRTIQMKVIPDDVPPPNVLPRDEAAYVAKQCVEALKKNPDDVAARERFARVLADSLGDAKTAIEQLNLLLAMPQQPIEKRADWLLTIANWYGKYRNDLENARLVYQEVMRDFPDSRYAVMAQRRLNLLTLQFRRRAAGEASQNRAS